MTLDLKAAEYALSGLRPFPVAVTTVHEGRTNGLMSLSAGTGSVIHEAPRVIIGIQKFNFSHDLIDGSGIFTMHLLGNGELLEPSLQILQALGGSSGRDGDKLGGLRTKEGVTGAPILLDALAYVEARVAFRLVNEESTMFLGDVVAAERLHDGGRLNIGEAWAKLPPQWVEDYERGHHAQVDAARVARGLPTKGEDG